MTGADSRILMLALQAWLDEDERNAVRIARHVIDRAIAGHSGFLWFVLNSVDGKIRPTAEDEPTGEVDFSLAVDDDQGEVMRAEAA